MTDSPTDQELLRRYAKEGSQAAFCSLVDRHLNLVYGTALRGLNQPEAAADVTQNVFILLARKSHWLCGKSTLAPWLHHAVLLEVRQWWRGEYRRQRRETTAHELGTLMKDNNSLPQPLAGALDEGLEELPETECSALLLRFFEGLSHREIGVRLGTSEDAARMRVNKALDGLTKFLRLRGYGYTVPAAAATAVVLSTAAKAAPPGLAVVTANVVLKAVGPGALPFLKPWLARVSGLPRVQTGVLCAALAMVPTTWQWNQQRIARDTLLEQKAQFANLQDRQNQAAAELTRLQAESARLDISLAGAQQDQARYASAAARLESLKTRIQGLLTNKTYRWPEDLPYVRVAKSEVASLDLLHKQGTFGPHGELNEAAQELLAVTSAEKGPAEQALGDYQQGIENLTESNAYQTNIVTDANGRITDTVVVPPLGEPLKTLAANTANQLTTVLGREREQLLFGDWDQGATQLFYTGNLWLIADQPERFTFWVQPNSAAGTTDYGSGWHMMSGIGMSTDRNGNTNPEGVIPDPIFQKFFAPWLAQYQLTQPASTGNSHE